MTLPTLITNRVRFAASAGVGSTLIDTDGAAAALVRIPSGDAGQHLFLLRRRQALPVRRNTASLAFDPAFQTPGVLGGVNGLIDDVQFPLTAPFLGLERLGQQFVRRALATSFAELIIS